MELTPELLLNLGESLGKTGKHAEMQAVLEQLVQKRASAMTFRATARTRSCLDAGASWAARPGTKPRSRARAKSVRTPARKLTAPRRARSPASP